MEQPERTASVGRKALFVTGFAALFAGAGLCLGAMGMISGPSANAGSSHSTAFPTAQAGTTPPPMQVAGSADEKIDTDGTQGSFKPAMDGTVSTGPQCTSLSATIACETPAEVAAPQDKAK